LNKRREDLPRLVRAFCGGRKFSYGFLLALLKYDWTDKNVGGLKAVVEEAIRKVRNKQASLTRDLLPLDVVGNVEAQSEEECRRELLLMFVAFLEKQGYTKGTGLQKQVATLLGVKESTVSRWFKDLR